MRVQKRVQAVGRQQGSPEGSRNMAQSEYHLPPHEVFAPSTSDQPQTQRTAYVQKLCIHTCFGTVESLKLPFELSYFPGSGIVWELLDGGVSSSRRAPGPGGS